jgi:paraquat-inducible protein B
MTFDLYDRAPEELIPVEEIAGLELRFSLPELHGLSVGSAVMFKGFQVGEVVDADLSEKSGDIEISAVVEEAYRHLVKTNSAFWLSGGLDLSLTSLFSSKQEATSFRDLLAGGITFANPPDAGEPVAARTVFKLLEKRPAFLDRESGLLVNLVSDEARGIAAEDPVLYRGLRVGKVQAVEISDDGTRINVKAMISEAHAGLVRENSVFWNASGLHFKAGDFLDASLDIDSLATLMVGGIAFETPGDPGSQAQNGASYSLLAERPHDSSKSEGQDDRLHIALEAATLGSVKSDDPILYRELEVGKVVDVGLSEDASRVRISLVIDAPYKALVKTNTVFWNASGLHASFGLFSGAKLDVESLSALLRGGIAFATPPDGGTAVKARTVFPLHASAKDEWKTWAPHIRLPKDEPQQSAGGASGEEKPKQSAAQTTADPSSESVMPSSAAEAQDVPEVTETVIRDPIPTSVTLGSGGRTSSSVLKSQLSDLGFEDIDKVEKEGNVFKLKASWEGQPLALVVDGANGRIEAKPR